MARTKTRNNETKQLKRNHRYKRNETTETKPPLQAKRNHWNETTATSETKPPPETNKTKPPKKEK